MGGSCVWRASAIAAAAKAYGAKRHSLALKRNCCVWRASAIAAVAEAYGAQAP